MTTLFVTGGTGFIGRVLISHAVVAGYQVKVLTRSEQSAMKVETLGAIPIRGDVTVAGPWQEAAASSEMIVHLAQPQTFGGRITLARANRYREERLQMDRLLLDNLRPDVTKRIVYVAGTSYYGDQGKQLQDESTRPNPKGWGPYIAPAIEALSTYYTKGLPILEAFPGWVYGPGSWFQEYIFEPLLAGKPLTGLAGPVRTASPVHVEDCARAILHLLQYGEIGQRYFIVDNQPGLVSALAEKAAQILEVRLRARQIPVWLSRLIIGPVVTESLTCDVCLSNARLLQTGFNFNYPTIEQGVPDVIARCKSQLAASRS